MYIYTIEVRGDTAFPIDMLRYDGCYPRTEEESHKIEASAAGRDFCERVVVLLTHRSDVRDWFPTYDRWASLGWKAFPIHREKCEGKIR